MYIPEFAVGFICGALVCFALMMYLASKWGGKK